MFAFLASSFFPRRHLFNCPSSVVLVVALSVVALSMVMVVLEEQLLVPEVDAEGHRRDA